MKVDTGLRQRAGLIDFWADYLHGQLLSMSKALLTSLGS